MAPHNLLSDSDSDDGSPAVRPTASRPKSKSAPPKSAKTEVQAGRSRAARAASDDGMDSDASDEPNDAALQAVMQQLTKQAFPVIRYRTRDLTRLLPGSAQPTMRRLNGHRPCQHRTRHSM